MGVSCYSIFTFVTVTFKCLWNLLMLPAWFMNLVTCVLFCFVSFFGYSPPRGIPTVLISLLQGTILNKWSESRSVVSDCLPPRGLYSRCNSPDQITGVGSLSLLQQICLTQELNWGILHCRQIIYQLTYWGRPIFCNKL